MNIAAGKKLLLHVIKLLPTLTVIIINFVAVHESRCRQL